MSNDIEAKKNELLEELDQLKHEFKIELPKRIAEAREHGDLKENADYHAARERQGFVKAKIAQLTEQLGKLSSINQDEIPTDSVGFGSTVKIQDVDSPFELEFTFVSEAETDPSAGKISISTPYGQALAGKKIGDVVEVNIPAGKKKFRLVSLVTIHGTSFS
ncbi:MAG: GreA/GreB family elongation factor [Spirochaetota bacterium]